MSWLDGITDSLAMNCNKFGSGDRQGSLVCCSPWGCKESDMPERLNRTELPQWTVCCTRNQGKEASALTDSSDSETIHFISFCSYL